MQRTVKGALQTILVIATVVGAWAFIAWIGQHERLQGLTIVLIALVGLPSLKAISVIYRIWAAPQ
jgi:hypothetical protein